MPPGPSVGVGPPGYSAQYPRIIFLWNTIMTQLKKPARIKQDPYKSKKWDEIVEGRNFQPADIPVLTILCHWYAVAERCIDDIDEASGNVAYSNDLGDLKALPQISILKSATSEIRQLNKQLGIDDTHEINEDSTELRGGRVIEFAKNRHQVRKSRAQN